MKVRVDALLAVVLPILAIIGVGWVWNIVKIAQSDLGALSGMLILRVVGIFVPPLGGVVGYF